MKPQLSILIVTWNGKDITRDCLNSIYNNVKGITFEVVITDNDSKDGTQEMITTEFPQAVLIRNDFNDGFAGGNNSSYAAANADTVLLLNQDTIVQPGALESMYEFLTENSEYGAATCKLLNSDLTTQYYMHRRFPTAISLILSLIHKQKTWFKPFPVTRYLYLDKDFSSDFDIEQAAGACIMASKNIINKLGGLFDTTKFRIYYNDVDLCYRIVKSGYKIRCICSTSILHLKGQSVKKLDFYKNGNEYVHSSLAFFSKHKKWVDLAILKLCYSILFGALGLVSIIKFVFGKMSPDEVGRRWSIFAKIY